MNSDNDNDSPKPTKPTPVQIPRTVIVTLELLTDLPLDVLKLQHTWERGSRFDQLLDACTAKAWIVEQVQVNVAKGIPVPAPKRAKKTGKRSRKA